MTTTNSFFTNQSIDVATISCLSLTSNKSAMESPYFLRANLASVHTLRILLFLYRISNMSPTLSNHSEWLIQYKWPFIIIYLVG